MAAPATDQIARFDAFAGFLVPSSTILAQGAAAIDTAQSTLTQAGPRPGVPEPQSRTALTLRSTGTAPADQALTVRTQRPGFPGTGGFVWMNTGDPLYRGWDFVNYHGEWERARSIAVVTSASPIDDIDAVTLPDDTVVLVYGTHESLPAAKHRVQASIRHATTGVWSTVTVVDYGTTFGTGCTPQPCLCLIPGGTNGRLLCFYRTIEDTDAYQVGMSYSDDGGLTWTVGAADVLPGSRAYQAAGTGAGHTEYVKIGRMRAAYLRDEILLVEEVKLSDYNVSTNFLDLLVQYASNDLGGSFVEVFEADTVTDDSWQGQKVNVLAYGGAFHVWFMHCGTGDAWRQDLGSAFEPLATAGAGSRITTTAKCTTTATAGTAEAFLDGDLAVVVDEDATVYAYIRDANGNHGVFVSVYNDLSGSVDQPQTPSAVYGCVAPGMNSQVYPDRFAACLHRGRVVLAHHHTDNAGAGTYENSIEIAYMGGFSTWTARAWRLAGELWHLSPRMSWLPYSAPNNIGWTAAGAGTATEVAGGLQIVTAANTKTFNRTFTATKTEGIAVELDWTIASGSNVAAKATFLRLQLGDGATYDYIVEFWFGPTSTALRDVNAGTTITTATTPPASAGIEIRVELVNGAVRWATRPTSNQSDREWTAHTGTTTLTDGGGAVSNDISWGHSSCTADSTSRRIMLTGASGVISVPPSEPFSLVTEQANPAGLNVRAYSVHPMSVDSGLRIMATGGPTLAAESWTIATLYDYAIERILPWVYPNVRHGWRSTNETVHRIAFDLQPDGEGKARAENGLIGLAVLGANWREGSLQGDTTGGGVWATIGAPFDAASGMSSMKYVRHGNMLIPDSGSTDKPYLYEGEAAGWTVNLGGGKFRRVRWNHAGVWNTTGKFARIVLEGCDGTEGASGTMSLWPTDFAVVFRPGAVAYAGYRLVIDAQTTVDGHFKIGSLQPPGPVQVFGVGHNPARVISLKHTAQTNTAPDGTYTARTMAPPARVVEVSWDFVDSSRATGSAPTPDYVTSTTTGGAEAVAGISDTHWLIEGTSRLVSGPKVPIVVLGKIEKGPSDTAVINRRELLCYGVLNDEVRVENVIGRAGIDEAWRVAKVSVAELP